MPPQVEVPVEATTFVVGSSDWEAEGRVPPRTVHVESFRIDAYETVVGRFPDLLCEGTPCPERFAAEKAAGDRGRAAYGVTKAEAATACAARGMRLPTEDEWMAASVVAGVLRRYPWGETGAVCRRAAWGLAAGPCRTTPGQGDTRLGEGLAFRHASFVGPDTAGAHPDGATPSQIHDLAGNVAEWVNDVAEVEGPAAGAHERTLGMGIVRGGSWRSALATDLRTWARAEVAISMRDARIGFRCARSGLR